MRQRSFATLFLAILAFLRFGALLNAQSSGIKITSPTDGAIVTPGQTINVMLEGVGGHVLENATAWIVPVSQTPQFDQTSPFLVPVHVPLNQVGRLKLVAIASDSNGNTIQDSIFVFVKSTSVATSIKMNPSRILFSAANGSIRSISVLASFQDGTSAYAITSPDLEYVSSNKNVAVVDSIGQVQAVAPGIAELKVAYSGFMATIPVSVGVFALRGDLNGDNAVDQYDLQILLNALYTTSTGPGDPRDLSNDGIIDTSDSQIMATLCSQPGCTTTVALKKRSGQLISD